MELDAEICERARRSRDARFDGRFFVAVTTTGIYCRPICPARNSARENVRYYPTAGAAAEAGFRPCLRCRPESAPGSPAWNGVSTTVSRTLRLVADGALRGLGVEELAARLGVTPRHVRRLFARHLGASPRAIAMTRRLHFAKKLLDETTLPVGEIALASGFGSVRSFNDAFRKTYDRAPRDVRRRSRSSERGSRRGGWTLELSYRPPMDWERLIGFLEARATPGVEHVESGTYRRTIFVGETAGAIEVGPSARPHAVTLTVHHEDPGTLFAVVKRVRELFDLDADAAEIGEHLGKDRFLASVAPLRPGLRVPGAWDGFELAVRAVLGQQVTVKAATTIAGRLVRTHGRPVPRPVFGGLDRLFPLPGDVRRIDAARLGIPAARARTIERLAEAVERGEIAFDDSMPSDEIRARMTALPGIGDWTAQYVAMRALRDPDAFPASDLGVLSAAARNGSRPTPAELVRRAEAWRPWRAYAVLQLWSAGS